MFYLIMTALLGRHGDTKYLEYNSDVKESVFDISPIGIEQILRMADIARPFLRNDFKKIALISRAWRTKSSFEVFKKRFLEWGILFDEECIVDLLRPMDRKNEFELKKIWEEMLVSNVSSDIKCIIKYNNPEYGEFLEIYSHINLRAMLFFERLINFSKMAQAYDQKTCIVAISHLEVLNHFFELFFESSVENGICIGKGEMIKLDFFSNERGKIKVVPEFRGKIGEAKFY